MQVPSLHMYIYIEVEHNIIKISRSPEKTDVAYFSENWVNKTDMIYFWERNWANKIDMIFRF